MYPSLQTFNLISACKSRASTAFECLCFDIKIHDLANLLVTQGTAASSYAERSTETYINKKTRSYTERAGCFQWKRERLVKIAFGLTLTGL